MSLNESPSDAPQDLKHGLFCKNIPARLAKRIILFRHFEQFGKVTSLQIKPDKGLAIVDFESHEQAANARRLGTTLEPGVVISLTWRKSGRTNSVDSKAMVGSPATHSSLVNTPSNFSKTIKSEADVGGGLYDGLPPLFSSKERNSIAADVKLETKMLFGKPVPLVDSKIDNASSTQVSGSIAPSMRLTQPSVAHSHKLRTVPDSAPVFHSFNSKPRLFQVLHDASASKARTEVAALPTDISSTPFGNSAATNPQARGSNLSTAVQASPTKSVLSQWGRGSPRPSTPKEYTTLPTDISINWILPSAMQCLRQTPAITCEERSNILDRRDKLLRQGMVRQQHIETARATVGVCPDMCPERERYLREEQRRVHVYELIPGTEAQPKINHSLAVKEYSRSSADQEEPLPHELRLPHALTKTMDYLCNNIMDRGGDGLWADWFDFLWSRTRAIRKDITQQHLCDRTAVDLVEKCTRFHIFCSERLCQEAPNVFDVKINNENLTKCLQTLKEMYADLANKSILCENEAEFRGYMVLMNLNEGDILREVQQLQPDVRSSREVTFALSAYRALNEANYVKFFHLVQKTSYLNACILHRYFTQIRVAAIKIILKAYTPVKGRFQMNSAELYSILSFDEEEEATIFLQHYGFPFEDCVPLLLREHFVEPETSLPLRRAVRLVESKRTSTIGQVVYGSPLPTNIVPEPTSSFDEQGYFIGIISVALDQVDEAVAESKSAADLTTSHQLPPFKEISNDIIKDVTKMVCLEVIDMMIGELVSEAYTQEEIQKSSLSRYVDTLLAECTMQLCRELAAETIDGEMKERQLRDRAEKNKHLSDAAEAVLLEIVDQVITQECQALAEVINRTVQVALHEQRVADFIQQLHSEYLQVDVTTLVTQLAQEVFKTDVLDRVRTLELCEQKFVNLRQLALFRKWRQIAQTRVETRNAIRMFPAAPLLSVPKNSWEFKVASHQLHVGKRCRLSLSPGDDRGIIATLNLCVLEKRLKLVLSNAPINIGRIALEILPSYAKDIIEEQAIKISVLLPDIGCREDGLLSDWLTRKLSHGSVPEERDGEQGPLHSLYHIDTAGKRIKVCVRSFRQQHLNAFPPSLYGTKMTIYLLPYTEKPKPEYWRSCSRLLSLFLDSKPRLPAVPLLIISPLDQEEVVIYNQLGIEQRIGQKLISACRVDRLDNTEDYTADLVHSVQWLVQHKADLSQPTVTDLRSYMESGLTRLFLFPAYGDLHRRQQRDLLHQDPNILIDLYNRVVEYLAAIASDKALEQLSWPAPELVDISPRDTVSGAMWNSPVGLLHTAEAITKCRLPTMTFTCPPSEQWIAARHDVWQYVQQVTTQVSDVLATSLVNKIRQILMKAESRFASVCRLHYGVTTSPLYICAPWTDVISACAEHVLCSATNTEKLVIFQEPRDLEFSYPEDWLRATSLTAGATFSASLEMAVKKFSQFQKPAYVMEMRNSGVNCNDTSFDSQLILDVSSELIASKKYEEFLSEVANRNHTDAHGVITSDHEDTELDVSTLLERERDRDREFEQVLLRAVSEA